MPAVEPHSQAPAGLRRDAARNRQKILDAAAELFAHSGLDASYDDIARRAGVGVGTVYRRFPARIDLVAALFETRLDELLALARLAARSPRAWDGLTQFLTHVVERQAVDRGMREFVALTAGPDPALLPEPLRLTQTALADVLTKLVDSAKAQGDMRSDVELADVAVLLTLVSWTSTPGGPDLWRRYLALVMDGLHRRSVDEPLPCPAPDDDTAHAIMVSFRAR